MKKWKNNFPYKVRCFDDSTATLKEFAKLEEARNYCKELKTNNNDKDYYIVEWYYQVWNTKEGITDSIYFM